MTRLPFRSAVQTAASAAEPAEIDSRRVIIQNQKDSRASILARLSFCSVDRRVSGSSGAEPAIAAGSAALLCAGAFPHSLYARLRPAAWRAF